MRSQSDDPSQHDKPCTVCGVIVALHRDKAQAGTHDWTDRPAKLVPKISGTGIALWQLPDSIFQIMWPGRGSRLIFGVLTTVGGPMMHIDHPTASGEYKTLAEAQAAVDAFSAAGYEGIER